MEDDRWVGRGEDDRWVERGEFDCQHFECVMEKKFQELLEDFQASL